MRKEIGAVSGLLIANIVLIVLVMGFGSVMIWALMNYFDQRDNVDQKITVAVEKAEKVQADELEKEFIEREKEPFRDFVGPADLGGVTFKYPKTWSAYIESKRENTFDAYLQPKVVHGTNEKRPYAVKVSVENNSYEDALKKFKKLVEDGELSSKRVKVKGFEGVRLDGTFSETVEGSMVVFKIRDKTLKVSTESPGFRNDFNKIILKTLKFNP
jgi:hypothetical protein